MAKLNITTIMRESRHEKTARFPAGGVNQYVEKTDTRTLRGIRQKGL
ncbi:hypothetical protein [uncultured Roseobacter sp.]|nr:hypothetical protein [uncultured Roseobacter sp.]